MVSPGPYKIAMEGTTENFDRHRTEALNLQKKGGEGDIHWR